MGICVESQAELRLLFPSGIIAWDMSEHNPYQRRSAGASWSKRLRKAHGTVLSEDQLLYDHYYAVVELLYRMVAWAIGYKGPIVETSKRGWGDVGNDQVAHYDVSSEGNG